jgi:hypothetical protein
MRLFREALPAEVTYPRRFDILVVDEAHNVAPSGRGHYAIDSLRTAAIRTIAPHFEHKLFVTATLFLSNENRAIWPSKIGPHRLI